MGLVLALAASAGWWYLHSRAFQRHAETYVLGRIETITGTRASAAGFHLSLHPLIIELRGVILRGKEMPGAPPLARIELIRMHLRLVSLWEPQVRLTRMRLEHPEVHLSITAAGESNLPSPRPGGFAAGPLFQLGVRQLILQQGELVFFDRRIPLNTTLRRLRIELRAVKGAFQGQMSFERSPMQYGGWAAAWQQAKAQFRLSPKALQLQSLKLSGNGMQLAFRGTLQPLTRPRFEGDAILQGPIPALLRMLFAGAPPPPIRGASGSLALHAQIEWQPESWKLAGGVAVQGLRLLPDAEPIAGQSDFIATPGTLVLRHLIATGWRGRLAGGAQYGPNGNLTATGKLQGVELEPILQALAVLAPSLPHPPRRLRLLSRFSGSYQIQASEHNWRQTRLELDSRLTASTAAASAGKSPTVSLRLQGQLDAKLRPFASAGEIRSMDLKFAGSELSASGKFNPRQLGMQLRFHSRQLADLAPVLAAWNLHAPPAGQLNASGRLTGSFRLPEFQGTIQAQALHYQNWQADHLTLAGTIAANQLRLQSLALQSGPTRLSVIGSIAWSRYHIQPGSRIDLAIAVRQLNLARFAHFWPNPLPLGGSVDASLRVHGTYAQPQGSGQVSGSRLSLWRQPIPHIAAHLQMEQGWWRLTGLQMKMPSGSIQGEAGYNPNRGLYSLQLATAGIPIESVRALQSPRLHITGLVRGSLRGAGRLTQPEGELSLEGINLRGAGESLGKLQATVNAANGAARLNATDQLPGGELKLSAVCRLTSPYLIDSRLSLDHYDADAWLRRFTSFHLTGHSQLSGVLTLQGPLQKPQELSARADFSRFEVAVEGLELHNAGPIELKLSGSRLALDRFHLRGTDTDLRASGHIGVSRGAPMQVAVKGGLGLALLESFNPHTRASGRMDVDLQLNGSLFHPLPGGRLRIEDGLLAHTGLPLALDHLNAALRLRGNRVAIESFTANAGGGELKVMGNASYSATSINYDLAILGQQLRMRYQGISTTADMNLHLAGSGAHGLLTGMVTLNRLALTPQFDLAVFIANRRGAGAGPANTSLLSPLRLDIHILTGPRLQISSSAARLQVHADLYLRGTIGNPILLGRVMAEEGRIRFAGNYYRVDKGDVEFADPFRIRPILNVALSTTVQQYEVTLNISGPVNRLSLTYRSNPPLSNTDIIALLATGHTMENTGMSQQATGTFVGQSEQLLNAALENAAANQVERMFGITRISVNPNTGSTYNSGSGFITIEQQISPKITFTYTQNLSTSSQDIIQVTWTLNPHFGVVISRDQYGIYGLSFHFHHSAR